ncbi:MAG: helix-turn-helix transcriptional regulator [Acidimicrobiales bacterium]
MRADRLIALLLLLQRRGRITAAEAAAELEVSPRTARRDLEALAMSGVPVYSTHGRGGGWELIGGASTDLTGLSSDEARALFLAAGPAVTATPELKSALQKLTSALPEPFQAEAEAAATAFKIDSSGWGQVRQPGRPDFLEPLTDAVVRGRQVNLDYQGLTSERRTRTVHPLGLVTKRNVWYLVARADVEPRSSQSSRSSRADGQPGSVEADDIRTFRVDRVRGVEPLDRPVVRPTSFDLDDAWKNIVTEVERRRATIRVRALIEPSLVRPLRWVFGSHQLILEIGDSPVESGTGGRSQARREVLIDAHSPESFAAQIAGFGDRIELVEAPDEVFVALADLGHQLYRRYCQPAGR